MLLEGDVACVLRQWSVVVVVLVVVVIFGDVGRRGAIYVDGGRAPHGMRDLALAEDMLLVRLQVGSLGTVSDKEARKGGTYQFGSEGHRVVGHNDWEDICLMVRGA